MSESNALKKAIAAYARYLDHVGPEWQRIARRDYLEALSIAPNRRTDHVNAVLQVAGRIVLLADGGVSPRVKEGIWWCFP